MLIATLQMQPDSGNKAANLARIEATASACASRGAPLLVAPEMCLTGYARWDDIRSFAEPRDGETVTRLQQMANGLNIAIVAGMPELHGHSVYNTAVAALPGGQTYFYRKCHLFGPDENRIFESAAQRSPLFEIGGIKTGMLICYDVEFPEWTRSLALAGANLIVVPTALPKSPANDRVSRALVPARALENHVFIAYAGLCGAEGAMAYHGGSCIVGPDGEDLARAGAGETLLVSRVDPASYGDAIGDPYLQDRRPNLYTELVV
jgi:predicted amidohydrolase